MFLNKIAEDNDTMMIIVDPPRDRKISSECDDMLHDLYEEMFEEISMNEVRNEEDTDYNNYDMSSSMISAMKSDYEWNYTMPILLHICGFYGLKKRGSKMNIIDNIVEFEINPENRETVEHRKKIFEFMRLIKEHDYMKRFIMFP
jgi:hypothetical protein